MSTSATLDDGITAIFCRSNPPEGADDEDDPEEPILFCEDDDGDIEE